MYLKNRMLLILKIKNAVLTAFACFDGLVSGNYIISEFVYYRDQPATAWNAVSMKSSIVWMIIDIILLLHVAASRRRMGDANFYSSYFEGDLDGFAGLKELSDVTGKSVRKIKRQLASFRKLYMKNYHLERINGQDMAELSSKTVLCQCRQCGAPIEKKLFFTGTCPYCDGSDLFAKVLTDDRFYSITSEFRSFGRNNEYYKGKLLDVKKVVGLVLLCLGALAAVIMVMMLCTEVPHYFDEAYQKKILFSPDNHLYSYALIKADILNTIVFCVAVLLVMVPLVLLRYRKTLTAFSAGIYAEDFARRKKPFLKAADLPGMVLAWDEKAILKRVRGAIRRRYLVNCTLESHEDTVMVTLAKKIVKDKCPSCGGAIVGAVHENYQCRYCGSRIMGVIENRLQN